jgi:hypothetical protein
MAERIPLVESGRVQVTGISKLPQPNMEFGQRRPEMAYQVASETSNALSQTLNTLTAREFGKAASYADEAGEYFVAQNPLDRQTLDAMSQGNSEKFKREFSTNAFSAAVNKYRSNEASAHAEAEFIDYINKTHLKLETGVDENNNRYEIDTKKISDDIKAFSDGWSKGLASAAGPDASYKFRAVAARYGNQLLLSASKKENELNFTKNRVKIDKSIQEDFPNVVRNAINNEDIFDVKNNKYITLNETINAEIERQIGNAQSLGGQKAGEHALKETQALVKGIKINLLQDAVSSGRTDIGGDIAAITENFRAGKIPADLKRIYDSMNIVEQAEARDKMKDQYSKLIDIKNTSREFSKQDSIISANNLKLEALSSETTDTRFVEIQNELTKISKIYPEVVSANNIYVDLPNNRKDSGTDDPKVIASLRDLMMSKDATLKTTSSVLEWASGRGIKASTALSIANEYLPKDNKANASAVDTKDLEYYLRTGFPDPKLQRRIKNIDDLKSAAKLRGLEYGALPDDFINLLSQKKESEDNTSAVLFALQNIDGNVYNSVEDLQNHFKGVGVKSETLISLQKRIGDRKLALETAAKRNGSDFADALGARSPTAKAAAELKGRQETLDEHKKDVDEWKAKGAIGPAPTIQDSGQKVIKRAVEERVSKSIGVVDAALESNYGSTGILIPSDAKGKIDLLKIQPEFIIRNNAVVGIAPKYEEALKRELARAGVTNPSTIENIVNGIKQSRMAKESLIMQRSQ